jgi:hypothetical protein
MTKKKDTAFGPLSRKAESTARHYTPTKVEFAMPVTVCNASMPRNSLNLKLIWTGARRPGADDHLAHSSKGPL